VGKGRRASGRDRQEHMTLDVVLLQDMVWHVVIDMIDINYMMLMASASDEEKASVSLTEQVPVQDTANSLEQVRVAVGFFVTLALFFHQQSFPSCSYVNSGQRVGAGAVNGSTDDSSHPHAGKAFFSFSSLWSGSGEDLGSVSDLSSPGPSGSAHMAVGRKQHTPEKEPHADVVKARKRSAIVSIILVDLPFFAIRTYLWSLSLSNQEEVGTSSATAGLAAAWANSTVSGVWHVTDTSGRPTLDKWWVKNILCMLLQAMQLRFVQQADLERSQTLRWWEWGRAGTEVDVGVRRRRRTMQDPSLKLIWAEMDRTKLDAAMEAAGGVSASASDDSSGAGAEVDEGVAVSDGASGVSGADQYTDNPSKRQFWASTALNRLGQLTGCCCCFRARRGLGSPRRCRCCSCDCSHSVILHGLMGLVLGWLIAKVDFAQAFTDLVHGLGWET